MRDGKEPAGLKPAFVVTSPALAEVVRDVNKYSNNVMAQQLFLTLALRQNGAVVLGALAAKKSEGAAEQVAEPVA